MTSRLGSIAAVACLLVLVGCGSARVSTDMAAPQLLEEARGAFQASEWARSIELADAVIARAELAPDREEARYLRAASHRNLGHFDTAFIQLKRFAEDFPISRLLPQVQDELFKLGVQLMSGAGGGFLGIPGALGMSLSGAEVLRALREISPNSAAAQNALRLIAQHYFETGEYDSAEAEYQTLIDEHPGGIFQPLAEYRLPLCKLRHSRGAAYDRRVLEDALRGFQDYEQKHPDGDYVNLARVHAKEVHGLLAEKSYRTGVFYLADKRVDAGVFYLKATVQDYPETTWAKRALDRLRNVVEDYPGTDAAQSASETLEVRTP